MSDEHPRNSGIQHLFWILNYYYFYYYYYSYSSSSPFAVVRRISELPDKGDFDKRLSHLQDSLKSLKKKRTEYADRILEDLRELRRQCNALEREMGKEMKDGWLV